MKYRVLQEWGWGWREGGVEGLEGVAGLSVVKEGRTGSNLQSVGLTNDGMFLSYRVGLVARGAGLLLPATWQIVEAEASVRGSSLYHHNCNHVARSPSDIEQQGGESRGCYWHGTVFLTGTGVHMVGPLPSLRSPASNDCSGTSCSSQTLLFTNRVQLVCCPTR